MKPKRGEVWWVNFDSSLGSEIQKSRPAVVISNDCANVHLDRFQVIPLTTQVNRLYPGEAIVSVKNKQGKAMTNQICTASLIRFGKKYTVLPNSDVQLVESALMTQLGLK